MERSVHNYDAAAMAAPPREDCLRTEFSLPPESLVACTTLTSLTHRVYHLWESERGLLSPTDPALSTTAVLVLQGYVLSTPVAGMEVDRAHSTSL